IYCTINKKEGDEMEAVNYSSLRNNLKEYMDKVTDDFETVIVTRKGEKNVVMISAEEYNNLMESVHLLGNEANRKRLMESKKQLEEGLTVSHSLLETD
ncbi:type II toxin-antitoxin system Phd/YefM family antitoxin, partial [Planococcus sp. ISL-109]|uniref:type II toxin-antitoxin system Phd/YefM family antitoxin n=1 Tax=Planococcus sp. ISL-109 TaxID=2819166 RepID=UPI001BE6D91F